MVSIDDRLLARQKKYNDRFGKLITYRHITSSTGANPVQNPPISHNFQFASDAAIGATSISLKSSNVKNGMLIQGDSLMILGDSTIYIVNNKVESRTNTFNNVNILPALTKNVSTDTTVNVTFKNEITIYAKIGSFSSNAMSNTLIKIDDIKITISASDINFTPSLADKIIIDNSEKTIVAWYPNYAQEKISSYTIQAR